MNDAPARSPATSARVLAEAMPYLREYHGKVIVVRFGGRAMADAALMDQFARDVALLRLVGMKLIVVHGGGWRVDELMRKVGIEPRRESGYRVTDAETLNLVEMALGELNQELTGLINRHGGRAVGVNGQDGRFIRARPMPARDGVDLGFVGDVASLDVELMHLLLSREFVPVVMPIGVGDDGTAYHINSDLLAGKIARALHAEKLVLMTNAPGIAGGDGRIRWIIRASEVQALLRGQGVDAEMAPRVEAALDAVREHVRSVHIIDGGVPDALLLEVLTADGVGTAIRSDDGPHFLEDSRAYLLASGKFRPPPPPPRGHPYSSRRASAISALHNDVRHARLHSEVPVVRWNQGALFVALRNSCSGVPVTRCTPRELRRSRDGGVVR